MANLTKAQREKANNSTYFEIATEVANGIKIALANNKLELKNISEEDFKKIKFGYDTATRLAVTAINNVVAKYKEN